MNKLGRNLSLDVARCVAILAVIMIHISAQFVKAYDLETAEFFYGNIFDSMSRLGVPLFVMISGSLFLDEKRKLNVKHLYLKNIKNIAIFLFIWSLIYAFAYHVIFPYAWYGHSGMIDLSEFINDIVMGHYHLWYLFMIIGLYAITPFLRGFVKKENRVLIFLVHYLMFSSSILCSRLAGIITLYTDCRKCINFH